MPKYLIQASYTQEGLQGLLREGGSKRRAATEATIASIGGRIESMHFAFGDTDVFIIADVPDNVSAAAASIAAGATGAVSSEVTVLLTPEEIDAATQKVVSYRPPGG